MTCFEKIKIRKEVKRLILLITVTFFIQGCRKDKLESKEDLNAIGNGIPEYFCEPIVVSSLYLTVIDELGNPLDSVQISSVDFPEKVNFNEAETSYTDSSGKLLGYILHSYPFEDSLKFSLSIDGFYNEFKIGFPSSDSLSYTHVFIF